MQPANKKDIERISGKCFTIGESTQKSKKKWSLNEKISLIGLFLAIITGVYFPIASYNKWPPFSPEPTTFIPQYQPVVQDVFLEESYDSNFESDLLKINDDRFPILDITVLNNGSEPIVFTRAVFTADKIWKIMPEHVNHNVTITSLTRSDTYLVSLPVADQENFSFSIKISQVLEPGEIDRFAFRLENDAWTAEQSSLFIVRLTVELVSGDGESLSIPDLILIASNASYWCEISSLDSDQFRLIIQEIENTNGTKSNGVIELSKTILND